MQIKLCYHRGMREDGSPRAEWEVLYNIPPVGMFDGEEDIQDASGSMWMFLDANYNYNYSYSHSYSNKYKHKNKNKTISISIQLTWSGAAENGAFWRRVSPRHPTGGLRPDGSYIYFIFLFLITEQIPRKDLKNKE